MSSDGRRIVRSEPDCSKALDELWKRLAQTIAWCEAHVDPGDPRNCLRPASLRPRALEPNYFAAVETVATLRNYEVESVVASRSLAGGRLLVYLPDCELSDGAAEAESEGFLDGNNCPPHGTWVGMFKDEGTKMCDSFYLLAWVPPAFLGLVEGGIDVNPEECIEWLDDSEVALHALLPELQ